MNKIIGAFTVVGIAVAAWAIYGEGFDLGTQHVANKMLDLSDEEFEDFVNDFRNLRKVRSETKK